MKKILLILAIAFFCVGSDASAEVTGTGKVVEIKDQITKTFMYQILLNPYISLNTRQFYHEKYQIGKSMEWEGPELEKIRIWIQEAKPASGKASYTHIVKVYIPYHKVIIDDQKELKTADTFVYAINGNVFSNCLESGKTEQQVKLINHYHKEKR